MQPIAERMVGEMLTEELLIDSWAETSQCSASEVYGMRVCVVDAIDKPPHPRHIPQPPLGHRIRVVAGRFEVMVTTRDALVKAA